MKADRGEQLSLAFQFVASFFWAIGAGLAEPSSTSDYLQFFAAVAWCFANVASAWSMYDNDDTCAAAVTVKESKDIALNKI